MDRIELEKRVQELNQLLHEYGHAYYVLDKPLVPDSVYDESCRNCWQLKRKILI